MSVYYTVIFKEHYFGKLKLNAYKKHSGRIYIAVLIFIFPTLLVRVESIKVLSENNPGKILENTFLAIS
jgi:CIC family chloride channel protein